MHAFYARYSNTPLEIVKMLGYVINAIIQMHMYFNF